VGEADAFFDGLVADIVRHRREKERRAALDATGSEDTAGRCAGCGGDAGENHFDRTLCACGQMHTCCNNCGRPLDECPCDASAASSASE
jgi:hypothetical protein